MSAIIVPDQLEADAVVPQCLDNQYVSDQVFNYLITNRVDYDHSEVRRMRKAEIQTEFMRSLIYSSQVVINRAAMKNNNYLYENYLPENRDSFQAFCKLMRQQAIVPFLFNESALTEESGFQALAEGDRALRALAAEVGDITSVRLAVEDEENRVQTGRLAQRFWEGLNRLYGLEETQRKAMASELFADPGRFRNNEAWTAFSHALDDLSDYARRKRAIVRNTIYKDHFGCEGCTDSDIATGRFRDPDRDHPFVLELKKLVDLIYNTNLPDRLNRYTFTPATLPSRMALQDEPVAGQQGDKLDEVLTSEETLEFIRRTFMANSQKAMTLPLLSELTVADVVDLRQLPEWESFKDSQRQILKDPLRCLDFFENFQAKFDAFQHAMSAWYNLKYRRPRTQEKYVSVVTFAVSIAGKLLVAGLTGVNPVAKAAVGLVPDFIPKSAKGYVAKLMVSVYDMGERRLDKDRSYSLELMRTAEEKTGKEIEQLLSRMKERSGELDAHTGHGSADQGKQ